MHVVKIPREPSSALPSGIYFQLDCHAFRPRRKSSIEGDGLFPLILLYKARRLPPAACWTLISASLKNHFRDSPQSERLNRVKASATRVVRRSMLGDDEDFEREKWRCVFSAIFESTELSFACGREKCRSQVGATEPAVTLVAGDLLGQSVRWGVLFVLELREGCDRRRENRADLGLRRSSCHSPWWMKEALLPNSPFLVRFALGDALHGRFVNGIDFARIRTSLH